MKKKLCCCLRPFSPLLPSSCLLRMTISCKAAGYYYIYYTSSICCSSRSPRLASPRSGHFNTCNAPHMQHWRVEEKEKEEEEEETVRGWVKSWAELQTSRLANRKRQKPSTSRPVVNVYKMLNHHTQHPPAIPHFSPYSTPFHFWEIRAWGTCLIFYWSNETDSKAFFFHFFFKQNWKRIWSAKKKKQLLIAQVCDARVPLR